MYLTLTVAILVLHLLWIVWVVFGALFTRGRRWLGWFHIASLVYSIVIEVGPWYCPLTRAEHWAQKKAGITPYEDDFLVHYLREIIYPRVPLELLVPVAVAICVFNLGIYVRRWRCSG